MIWRKVERVNAVTLQLPVKVYGVENQLARLARKAEDIVHGNGNRVTTEDFKYADDIGVTEPLAYDIVSELLVAMLEPY